MNIDILLGLAYWLVLLGAALLTAAIKPGRWYALACTAFVLGLPLGAYWASASEDGPVGFAVIAVHGLILWVFLIAHFCKWAAIMLSVANQKWARRKGACLSAGGVPLTHAETCGDAVTSSALTPPIAG